MKEHQSGQQIVVHGGSTTAEALGALVRDALLQRRQAIVYAVARMILQQLQNYSLESRSPAGAGGTQWEPIYSLSQLRTTVGGRFRNIKEKWMEAGFPLRSHRGDRAERAAVNPEGWVELSNWIARQGFETRLGGEDDDFLFEVRRSSSSSDPDE